MILTRTSSLLLNETKETKINEDNINLDAKWGIVPVVNHTTLLNSLSFDYLAANDAQILNIVFLHATPGFVNTSTPCTAGHFPPKSEGSLW